MSPHVSWRLMAIVSSIGRIMIKQRSTNCTKEIKMDSKPAKFLQKKEMGVHHLTYTAASGNGHWDAWCILHTFQNGCCIPEFYRCALYSTRGWSSHKGPTPATQPKRLTTPGPLDPSLLWDFLCQPSPLIISHLYLSVILYLFYL